MSGCQIPKEQFEYMGKIQDDMLDRTNMTEQEAWNFAFRCWQCGYVNKKEIESQQGGWIPVSEQLPDCEVEVQVTTRRKYADGTYKYTVTNAFYENGNMLESNSDWNWNDCDFEKYDDEECCYIIDEGWWEYKHYNPDYVYNNAIDDEVIAWQPLSDPYREVEKCTAMMN